MTDLPRIPDEQFCRLGSKRNRQIARDSQTLLMIAMATTIEDRDAMADQADIALKRLRKAIVDNKQNPKRWGNLDRVFRLPELVLTIRELNGAALGITSASILLRDRNPRFLQLARDIHELVHLLAWRPENHS